VSLFDPEATVNVEVVLPVEAVQLLYDVLGHFGHEPGSWSNVARGNCSVGLWEAKNIDPEETPQQEPRWEVTALIGPCSSGEAEAFFEDVLAAVEAAFGVVDRAGAAWGLSRASDEVSALADAPSRVAQSAETADMRRKAETALLDDFGFEVRDFARDVVALTQELDACRACVVVVERRAAELEAALQQIAAQQQETLAMIERNGFVFDSIGCEPGNWQHLAFTIYTDLCKVDTVARSALDELAASLVEGGGVG
jgi:hypothetical protein